MTFRRRRRFAWFEIAPAPRRVHCVWQQCFHFVQFSSEAPHHKRCARQTVLPDVRAPDCRRSFDGWAEETLAEPHRNKALGCHDSYLRGIWHLKGIWIGVSPSGAVMWGHHESSKGFGITCHILSFSASLFSSVLFLFASAYKRGIFNSNCTKWNA